MQLAELVPLTERPKCSLTKKTEPIPEYWKNWTYLFPSFSHSCWLLTMSCWCCSCWTYEINAWEICMLMHVLSACSIPNMMQDDNYILKEGVICKLYHFSLFLPLHIADIYLFKMWICSGCNNEDHFIFSTRASRHLHSLCQWRHFKCYTQAAWFFWWNFDIWGLTNILLPRECF